VKTTCAVDIIVHERFIQLALELDSDGKPVAWQHRIVCQSFVVGTAVRVLHDKGWVDETAVEGAKDIPYEIPNLP